MVNEAMAIPNLHPYLQQKTAKVYAAGPDGASIRSANKERRRRRHYRKATKLLVKLLPCLALTPVDVELYESERQAAFEGIMGSDLKKAEIGAALDLFDGLVREVNRNQGAYLPTPPTIVQMKRSGTFRSRNWFKKAASLNAAIHCLMGRYDQTDTWRELSRERALAMCLCSAALNGALFNADDMLALANALTSGVELKSVLLPGHSNQMLWIELSYRSDSHGNAKRDDDLWQEIQYFPDLITLGWIGRYSQVSRAEGKAVYSKKNLWEMLSRELTDLGFDFGKIRSLKTFGEAAVHHCERRGGVRLSEASIQSCLGRIQRVGLRHDQWDSFLQARPKIEAGFDFDEFDVFPKESASERTVRYSAALDQEMAGYNSRLREMIAHKSGKYVRSANEISRSLECDDHLAWPLCADILRKWLLFKIGDETGGVDAGSSLNTYMSQIGSRWLEHTSQITEVRQLTAPIVESIYVEMVESGTSRSNKCDIADRLGDFQRWAHREIEGFPDAEVPEVEGVRGRKVRSALIPVSVFEAVRESLLAMKGLDKESKQSLAMMWTCLYWSGARVGEMVKSRLVELENLGDLLLTVQANPLDKNKNEWSARKLPFHYLMPEKDLAQLEDWISQRRLIGKRNDPIFECGVGTGSPWNKALVSALFSTLLRKCGAPSGSVTHDLRHTRISVWAMILEGEYRLVESMGLMGRDRARLIHEELLGGPEPSPDSYWRLAILTGHASPETLLTTYAHMGNVLVGAKVARADVQVGRSELGAVFGFSANKITRLMNKHETSVHKLKLLDVAPQVHAILRNVTRRTTFLLGEAANDEDGSPSDRPIVLEQVHALLVRHKQGISIPALALEFGYSVQQINEWLTKAHQLTDVRTRKGVSRLTGKFLLDDYYVPPEPRSEAERVESRRFIEHLRSRYPKDIELIRACILYYLMNTTHSSSGVAFFRKSDLRRFLRVMSRFYPPSRWQLRLNIAETADVAAAEEYWRMNGYELSVNARSAKGKPSASTGTLSLHLLAPDRPSSGTTATTWTKYTSTELRYAMPMLAILLLTQGEIHGLSAEEAV